MIKLKSIKPVFSQVLVTKELYGWDDYDESGLILHKKGDLKDYQTVIAIGDDVRITKPGDLVDINFYKYAIFKEDPNSVKAMADNPIVGLRLHELEIVGEDGEDVPCFLIDQRDINYIIEDYEEVTYKNENKLIIEHPKTNLILPNTGLRV